MEDITEIEDDNILEDETSSDGDVTPQNATGAGKSWESGVTRGKGNPISNHGKWESGVIRGKDNPISNHGNWESGVTRGKGNPLTVSEQIQKMKDLIAKL